MSILNNSLLLAADAAGGGASYQIERSLRFNSSDSAFLSRTPASAGNRKTWTWAGWVKRSALTSSAYSLFAVYGDSSNRGYISYQGSTDKLLLFSRVGGSDIYEYSTNAVFRDASAWYHVVIAFDTTQATASNRLKIYVNGVEQSLTATTTVGQNVDTYFNTTQPHYLGYQGGGDAYFSGYLADVHFIDGQALTPSSFTETSATTGQLIPKQYTGSFGTNGFWLKFSDNSAATASTLGKDYSGNSNNWTPNNFSVTGLVDHTPAGLSYRDSSTTSRNWDQSSASSTTSAAIGPDRIYWVDLGASKSFNRITFSVVASGQSSDTSTNFITYFSTSSSSTGSTICGGGCTVTSASRPSATTPGTITVTFAGFASQTGRYIGITNGSGAQGGTYTYSSFKVYDDQGAANDSLVDSPTSYGTDTGAGGEVRGNYCTLNPLDKNASATLTNGNLDFYNSSANHYLVRSTFGISSGKWYWEVTVPTDASSAANFCAGICTSAHTLSLYVGGQSSGWGLLGNGNTQNGPGASYTTALALGDVIGIAFDADNGKIWWSKNGTYPNSGNPATGANAPYSNVTGGSGPYFPAVSAYQSAAIFNGGQRPFAYTAPSGFKALCDTNLPTPVVAKPSTVMDVKLYTGNGSTQTISGLGFSPDLVWIKARTGTGNAHVIQDQVRGATAYLFSNSLTAENTNTGNDWFRAFTSDGFTVAYQTTGGTPTTDWNANTVPYVAWTWDAGTTTSSNGSGSITSSVRANPSAGFSIVTYTGNGTGGATVGHGGLVNLANGMIIVKRRDSTVNWFVGHGSQGWTKVFEGLNTTAAISTTSAAWNNTSPTSTVFTLGTETSMNGNGGTFVAYCFAPVAGLSSFGSYTGNGSSDGPFVFTGMRPRWVMVKRTDAARDWFIYDAARNTFNIVNNYLRANLGDAEGTNTFYPFDFLSNGFKLRSSETDINGSGGTWIYAAFAENPLQYARAR